MNTIQRKFDFGEIGHQPLCPNFGFSRGKPIDRRYIEEFLLSHAADISGRVLEVGDASYTQQFGGARVHKSEVIDLTKSSDSVTIIGDLTSAPQVPTNGFDCIIMTQVLERILRFDLALKTTYRILRPGGVALITVPGISQISPDPLEASQWTWTFYPRALRSALHDAQFDDENLVVGSRGNLRTTIGFLAGLAQEDLSEEDFAIDHIRYPLIVTARVTKRNLKGSRLKPLSDTVKRWSTHLSGF